jgi:hypothetical protein
VEAPKGGIVHDEVPLPLGQAEVNWGFWLDGCAVSVTDTPGADPPSAETSTTYMAALPRSMLDSERWTLTHSCADDVELGLGLAAR